VIGDDRESVGQPNYLPEDLPSFPAAASIDRLAKIAAK
jgi:hypothetical protein